METLFDHTQSRMERASVHHIGNSTNEEDLILSKNELDISGDDLHALMLRFFIQSFTSQEFFNFSFSNGEVGMNPLFAFTERIFEKQGDFHTISSDIAKQLYEVTDHPNIKSGDLFVVHFSALRMEHQDFEAIGIFKSENRHAFLKLNSDNDDFSLDYDAGINIEKLDKGCIILNTDKEDGYKICLVDRSNKGIEARYWRDEFLGLKPCADEYYHTKEFMNITKNYVAKQMPGEFELTRAEQIDLLNRSVEYFKTNEEFDKAEFEEIVFQDKDVIDSFRNYDSNYREQNELEMDDNFGISPYAVKKQARVFKSVLKLDKNFHIYIHGDKNLIERGVENDGRKFYKIYYEEEL
ncbi:MAG: nucleoid-associated protein [Bacteroidales bacterium]|nr:nucleoid-associated protein [Bacteroidales bacterium]MCF8455150.1 nucleoid-associated protein [Bacteroidales bacterium]